MNFLKKLLKKQEPHPSKLALSTVKEITTRLKQATELRLSGEYGRALIECNDVLLLHPTSHYAYHIRALTKHDMGDLDGAIQDWNRFKIVAKVFKINQACRLEERKQYPLRGIS